MYHQFNIQQFYVLPTQCMYFVWILKKQRLFPFTALIYKRDGVRLLHGTG